MCGSAWCLDSNTPLMSVRHTSLDTHNSTNRNFPSSICGYRNQSIMYGYRCHNIRISTEFNYDQFTLGRFTSETTQFKCQRININLRPQNALCVFYQSVPPNINNLQTFGIISCPCVFHLVRSFIV